MVEPSEQARSGFAHDALLFGGSEGLLAGVVPFISAGLANDEPVLVALPTEHLDLVRGALGDDGNRVEWLDLRDVGQNPARIIPAWAAFVDRNRSSGTGFRGVGEPIWPNRSAEELVECQLHEQLLNVAFADSPPWTLLCPYDVDALSPAVIDVALGSHPCIQQHQHRRPSGGYRPPNDGPLPGGSLAPVPDAAVRLDFDADNLADVRELARLVGDEALGRARALDQGTAVHEIAANSVRHGGGTGTARAWTTPRSVIVQVEDAGWIADPLAGRRRPDREAPSGRGLWMANQLCDLVQVRSSVAGTTVRLHQHRP